ncbi:MAG: hypothetical protein HW391_599 [Chloroflexi bacterium]|nr:hypothetical protein [Chloroflexota bacterium]
MRVRRSRRPYHHDGAGRHLAPNPCDCLADGPVSRFGKEGRLRGPEPPPLDGPERVADCAPPATTPLRDLAESSEACPKDRAGVHVRPGDHVSLGRRFAGRRAGQWVHRRRGDHGASGSQRGRQPGDSRDRRCAAEADNDGRRVDMVGRLEVRHVAPGDRSQRLEPSEQVRCYNARCVAPSDVRSQGSRIEGRAAIDGLGDRLRKRGRCVIPGDRSEPAVTAHDLLDASGRRRDDRKAHRERLGGHDSKGLPWTRVDEQRSPRHRGGHAGPATPRSPASATRRPSSASDAARPMSRSRSAGRS